MTLAGQVLNVTQNLVLVTLFDSQIKKGLFHSHVAFDPLVEGQNYDTFKQNVNITGFILCGHRHDISHMHHMRRMCKIISLQVNL